MRLVLARRPARSALVVAVVAVVALLAACREQAVAPTPRATRPPIAPIVQMDQSWTAIGGHWTFTGYLDPEGYPSDVALDYGQGSVSSMQVLGQVPVAQAVSTAGPITVTTSQIPKVDQVCVRFAATSQIGSSTSQPLCFPYTPPTAQPPVPPSVEIQTDVTFANGAWTFAVSVDPGNALTSVALQIGHGPASKPVYTSTIEVAKGVSDTSTIQFTTKDLPEVSTVCVRFVATNSAGKASSDPLCFPRDSHS
jgi:hypothetical protein